MHTKSLLVAVLTTAVLSSPVNNQEPRPSSISPRAVNGTRWAPLNQTAHESIGNQTALPNPTVPSGLISKLLAEPNTVGRFADLKKELEAGTVKLKFDFNPSANPGVVAGAGGQVDLAQRSNFPFLTGTGISAASIFFEPCGLNTPHLHPRATEFLTLATDSRMLTGFVLENGLVTEFNTTLTQYQGTVFPQGSIHFQQNLDCRPAVAIAGLNSEDPGASSIAQNFILNVDSDIVDATLGFPKQIDAKNFARFKENLPPPLARGVEECLSRCRIAD